MKRRGLYRSRRESLLLGVCGGLAEYFDVEPLMVRILFVGLQLTFFPPMFLVYLGLGLIIKKRSMAEFISW